MDTKMNRISPLFALTFVTLGLAAPVFADTAKQTIMLTQVDPTILATGWRATNIIGATVYDDAGENIGKVEDMIITDKA
jgi:hypothetical protein